MYRRDRDNRRRPRRNNTERRPRSVLMRPGVQITILLVVALIIFIILQSGGSGGNSLPREISVDEAYGKYQNGTYVLDVRTVEEWNEFHAPNSTLIPLDELATRISELPRDKEIVVVCRSGNRSQQARDILLGAGFDQVTSMAGGLNEWRTKGYPIAP
jgi:rhodanese-related sulfurtransferase